MPLLGPALLCCFLLAGSVRSAPVQSGPVPVLVPVPVPVLVSACDQAKTLVEKILNDVMSAHAATITTQGLDLDSQTGDHQLIVKGLGIPDPPVLKPLTETFSLEVSVSRMASGVRLYQRILGVLSVRVEGLGVLQVDLRDLQTRIAKMREAAQLGTDQDQNQDQDQDPGLDLESRLHGDYEVQVATHTALKKLRSFCHDLIRSLRNAAAQRPHGAQ